MTAQPIEPGEVLTNNMRAYIDLHTKYGALAKFAEEVLAFAKDCLEEQVPYYEEQLAEWGSEQGKDDAAKAEIYHHAGTTIRQDSRRRTQRGGWG